MMARMGRVVALPARGHVVADERGGGRALRASWHHEAGVVVLSLWQGDICTGTFRARADDVPALVEALTGGLAEGYRAATTGPDATPTTGSVAARTARLRMAP
jgi:hypothetical protein